MKASRVLIVCLLLCCRAATAQVWQMQITRVGSTKETGIGYMTLSEDGSVTGYSITTLTLSVPTYVGSWSSGAHHALTMTLTETLEGQRYAGEFSGKFSSKSITGTAVFENGVTYKLKGVPARRVFDVSGNWVGTVKQSGQTAPESFNAVANTNFSRVFDFSGTVNGSLPATGQVIIASSGAVVGYSVDSAGSGGFTGKLNVSKGSLSIKGIDQNGVKESGKFTRE